MLFLCSRESKGQFSVNQNLNFPASIHSQAEIAQVDSNNYTLEELLENENNLDFTTLNYPITDLGFTDKTYWLRFTLENESEQAQTFLLETARPITDVVHLYQVSQGKVILDQLSGDLIKFKDRPFKHRKLIFPITIAANSASKFYIKYQSDGEVISLPLLLFWNEGIQFFILCSLCSIGRSSSFKS